MRILLALALCAALPATAQIQGVGYRLSPSASYVDFAGGSGLSDGVLLGGGVGFSFGEFVELGGSFQLGSFETALAGVEGFGDVPTTAFDDVAVRGVDVQRYGGALKLNLSRGAVVPHLTAGTGVVRLAPDALEATRSIYLVGGAGVQLSFRNRLALAITAEDFVYRTNVGTAFLSDADLATAGVARADFEQTTVHNLGARVTANLYLGGRRPGQLTDLDRAFQEQFAGGLSGLSLVVEPFYGRVTFDEALPFRDQAFVGAEAGFDFGPLIGVRGFYGRGIDTSDPTQIEGVQMFGGDLRLRLTEGRGLVPFLSVGGGYLDVLDGYATDDGADPENALAEDSPFAAAGLGVGFLVTPRLRAVVEGRALLLSTQDEGDLSEPDDVYLSPMLRAGVSFGVGGRSGRPVAAVRASDLDAERAQMEAERSRLVASRDSARAALATLAAQQRAERARLADREARLLQGIDVRIDVARSVGDSVAVAQLELERYRLLAALELDSLAAPERPALNEREADHMVTIPLPREGELYVRYGPPGGLAIESMSGAVTPALSEADLREVVRASLRDLLASQSPGAPPISEADLAALEDRLVERVASRFTPAPGPTAGAATTVGGAPVTADDLRQMEARLEARLLRAIREATRD